MFFQQSIPPLFTGYNQYLHHSCLNLPYSKEYSSKSFSELCNLSILQLPLTPMEMRCISRYSIFIRRHNSLTIQSSSLFLSKSSCTLNLLMKDSSLLTLKASHQVNSSNA